MIHPKDKDKPNPRIQCSICGKWKRLHGTDKNGIAIQRFFGGCNSGGEHRKDICQECCDKHHISNCEDELLAEKLKNGFKVSYVK